MCSSECFVGLSPAYSISQAKFICHPTNKWPKGCLTPIDPARGKMMLLKIPFVLTPQVSALIDLTKKASLGILRKARERTRGPEQGCPLGRWGRILVTNRGCAGHSGSCDGEHRGNPSSCSSGILCTVTGTSEPGHSLWLAG